VWFSHSEENSEETKSFSGLVVGRNLNRMDLNPDVTDKETRRKIKARKRIKDE
jgi:hypothetical protein